MAIERLIKAHDRTSFDCGVPALNDFLQKSVLQNQTRDLIQTHVTSDNALFVRGFYTLAAGSIRYDEADEALSRGAPKQYDIPIVLLARLGVTKDDQSVGLGSALLKDAIKRTLSISENAGVKALVVDAKDDRARAWYEKFDFAPFAEKPLRLFMLTKKMR